MPYVVILIRAYIKVVKNSQIFRNNSSAFYEHLDQSTIFQHAIQSNKINLRLKQTNILFNIFQS